MRWYQRQSHSRPRHLSYLPGVFLNLIQQWTVLESPKVLSEVYSVFLKQPYNSITEAFVLFFRAFEEVVYIVSDGDGLGCHVSVYVCIDI